MANTDKKTEKKLIVKFKVEIGDKVYRAGVYNLSWKEREALAKAPYVREQTDAEVQVEADALKRETAARKAKGVNSCKSTKAPADETGGDTGGDNGGDNTGGDGNDGDDIKLTEDELRGLDRDSLVAYYEKETGKTAPGNIGDETMITNLLK